MLVPSSLQNRNKRRMLRHLLRLAVVKALSSCGLRQSSNVTAPKQEPTVSAAESFCCVLTEYMASSSLSVASCWRSWLAHKPTSPSCRSRDLFPLPRLESWPSQVDSDTVDTACCLQVANMCLAALNSLEQGLKPTCKWEAVPTKPTAAQLSVQHHVAGRVARFLGRLNGELGSQLDWRNSFHIFEESSTNGYQGIRAADVDLPATAATCEPLDLISQELAAAIADDSQVFPEVPKSQDEGDPFFSKAERDEYIQLTVRELNCGKLRLRPEVEAVAGIFAAGKSGGRQRKIWNGASVSQLAQVPPKPRRLANPSCFLDVDASAGERLYFSKRDAATFFDALKVPKALQKWFGQPAVQVRELVEAGMSLETIFSLCDDLPSRDVKADMWLYPANVVWPMGFSWSSAVAQDTTLAVCARAGIREESILSPDHGPPQQQQELVFVATDDTVLVHRDCKLGMQTLSNLDAAFLDNGIPRNVKKDVTLASSITALGCDLCASPPVAEPGIARLCQVVGRTLDLLHNPNASPRGVLRLLGVWEWFVLLQRSMFSIYDAVYSFSRKTPEHQTAAVPDKVLNEFLTTLLLAPLLTAGLDRRPLSTLVATDACPEYGFGVCAAECSQLDAFQVCNMAERRGDFVRLTTSASDPVEVPRLGKPRRLPIKQQDFKTVVSCRARWPGHSGVLEMHGYMLGLKWAARHPRRHHRKIPFLVDAKAVVGAAAKGRSSVRSFLKILRSAAAYTLAADILPRIVYIPSESNPADAPSRGRKLRRGRRCQSSDQFCIDATIREFLAPLSPYPWQPGM